MIVGFTGTRRGMSGFQEHQLRVVLEALETRSMLDGGPLPEFHHGAAVGADTEAARIARARSWNVIPHPAGGGVNPLVRNRDIVEICAILITAPYENVEILRSGTWATVRYARAAGKPIIFLSRGTP